MATVEIYTKSFCPFCQRAKELLKRKQQEFSFEMKEFDVQNDEAKLKEMLERSDGRTTVPEIFIDGKLIGGYDDIAALDADGKLNPLLG